MDLRVKKTQAAIKNAFMELRAKKPLERISIKELCELAMINKSTFYFHYQDIYALSDTLENEVVSEIANSLSDPVLILTDPAQFTKELFYTFLSQGTLINLLFSGNQRNHLSNKIEQCVKQKIFEKYPDLKDNLRVNVVLTFCLQGGYSVIGKYRKENINEVIHIIGAITENIHPLYQEI